MKDRGAFSRCIRLSRRGLSAARCCLKQDGQDAQEEQEDTPSPRDSRATPKTRPQVREDLNVYRHQQEHDAKVREDLNSCGALDIKVFQTFSGCCAYVSIDIKVFQTFSPHS